MPSHQSAEALLSDVDLRLDTYGQEAGLLIVEGPDDKRLFSVRTLHRQQVIGAGGRRLLLAAHALANERGRDDLLFVTDCDYEVVLGRLHPAPNLVITKHTDVEADLVALGAIERIVGECVPATLDDDTVLGRTAEAVLARSVALAEVLGVLRKIAAENAYPIDTEIRHSKYRTKMTSDIDEVKLVRAVIQRNSWPVDATSCVTRVQDERSGLLCCNGHDLAAAISHVLRDDFGVNNLRPHDVELLMRHGLQDSVFEEWSVVQRIRAWQARTSHAILR